MTDEKVMQMFELFKAMSPEDQDKMLYVLSDPELFQYAQEYWKYLKQREQGAAS